MKLQVTHSLAVQPNFSEQTQQPSVQPKIALEASVPDSFTPSVVQERSGAGTKRWAAMILASMGLGLHQVESNAQHFVYDGSPARVEEVTKALFCESAKVTEITGTEVKDKIYLAGKESARHIATWGRNKCHDYEGIRGRLSIGRMPHEGELFSGIKNKYWGDGQTAVLGRDLGIPDFADNSPTPFIVAPAGKQQ
jgi:hypothetical protein